MLARYSDESVRLYHGDCIEVMRQLPDASVDAVVTDPPYELGFMGKHWDGSGIAYRVDLWQEVARVLKPGGHLLAFGGTRTWHRLACAIEDAGFEVRDSIAWMYGSGFPKSLDVSKAMDKAAGAERELKLVKASNPKAIGQGHDGTEGATRPFIEKALRENGGMHATAGDDPVTDLARQWQGWGTALKPAFEPVVVARKPLIGTVAANVQEYGTGALNIDRCRVLGEPDRASGWSKTGSKAGPNDSMSGDNYDREPKPDNPAGRWPANVILDESQAEALDRQSGVTSSPSQTPTLPKRTTTSGNIYANGNGIPNAGVEVYGYADTGGASRFFYTAKADSNERPRVDVPCDVHDIKRCTICGPKSIAHPTVKPLDLMRYLVRLVTPPGGVVLEPFAGSGTTAEACIIEGFRCIAIEREADYIPLILARITKPIEVTLL